MDLTQSQTYNLESTRDPTELLRQFRAYHSVRKRMSVVLLKLDQQHPKQLDWLKITREEIASLSGMATETVSRILSDFTSEKLIEKKGRLIRVVDKPRLAALRN